MILMFWALKTVLLLTPFANAQWNFTNSTFHSSIVKLNMSSPLTATVDNGSEICTSLRVAWIHSVWSVNRNFSVSTISEMAVNYSSILYTLDDGVPRLSLISTAIYMSTSLQTIYPTMLSYPDCSKLLHGSCGKCSLGGGDIEVNYWPIKNISSHFNVTNTSNNDELVTAVIDGFTFTSPTVYLSFQKLGTYNDCGMGSAIKTMVGINASGLSSYEFKDDHSSTLRRVNFEDLNGPVPARAYLSQHLCILYPRSCLPPIRPDNYNAALSFPPEIKNLFPGWENCDLSWSFDPPRILQPAQALAGPTSEPNADPPSPTILPQASFRPLGPVRTADHNIGFFPSVAPDPPSKTTDPAVKDPPSADSSAKIQAAQSSPEKNPAAKNFPENNSHGTDGLTQDPSGSGGSSPDRVAIITLGSQEYTANAKSHLVIASKTLSVGGAAAMVSGQTVSLNTDGVIVGGAIHAFSAVASTGQSNLDTVEAMLYTAVSGKKVIVIGSSTLSAGGEGSNVGRQTLSVGSNGIIVGSKTIDFSAFEPSKSKSDGIMIGGNPASLAGIYHLNPQGELKIHHTSEFPPASTSQSKFDTVEAMLYTAASGKKVVVIGSSTLSVGGETGNVGSQIISVGANGIIVGSKTIDFSAFETSRSNPEDLTIGGKPVSLAGIYHLKSPGELQMHYNSEFPPASQTVDPSIRHILPTVVIVSAEKFTVDSAGQYLVDGKTFTLKDAYSQGANLATMISNQLVASAAKVTAGPAPPTIIGAQTIGSLSTSVGIGQLILDGFNGGGAARGSGETGGRGAEEKDDGSSSGRTSGPVNNTSEETGAGVIPYTGRAAERSDSKQSVWLIMLGVTATWWIWEGRR